jgi:hypothetical protein
LCHLLHVKVTAAIAAIAVREILIYCGFAVVSPLAAISHAIYDDPTTPVIPLAQKMAQSTKLWDQFNQPIDRTFTPTSNTARITVPGFSTDMYYLGELDATLPISVNRLDYDDVLRTLSILKIVSDMLAPHSGSRRMTMSIGVDNGLPSHGGGAQGPPVAHPCQSMARKRMTASHQLSRS